MIAERNRPDSGFTLVEMLIALFIFALLSAGAMSAMFSSIQTKDRLGAAVEAVSEIETARALIKSDMANVILRTNRDPYGSPEQYSLSGGAETLLTFTRTGRENPGGLEKRGDVQRVAYVFEDNNFLRRSFAADNPAPLTPLRDRVLIANLDNVDISFEDDRISYSQVYVPSEETVVPVNLVVLTITFKTGDELVQKFELNL